MCIYNILIRSGQIGINRSLCVAVRLFWGFDGLLIHLFSVLYMTTYAKGHQYGLRSFVRSAPTQFISRSLSVRHQHILWLDPIYIRLVRIENENNLLLIR